MSETQQGSDWWCPQCKEALSPSHVTYQERCDTCGTPCTTVDDEASWKAVADRLAEALRRTIEVTRAWHGEEAWIIYHDNCPELRPYRDAIAEYDKLKGAGDE